MANLLEDIVAFYVDNNMVVALGTDAFTDIMPEMPDSCLAVYEYQGGPQPFYADISARSIQVVVRDLSHAVARQKALDLYNTIVPATQRQDLTALRWSALEAITTPFKLKVDTKGRSYYAFNLELITYVDYN